MEAVIILRYLEIKKNLLAMIDGMNSGEQLPSRSMLVKRFDSSRATVDKAINELEQEGVLESHSGSGTYVRRELEGVVHNLSNWCLILPNSYEIIYGKLAASVERAARGYNANVILCCSDNNVEKQSEYIKRLSMAGVDGFIIVPAIIRNQLEGIGLFKCLDESKIPFVFCNREVDGVIAPVIKSNDFYGGYMATCHLLEHGYENIVYFSTRRYRTSVERCQGYISALQQHGKNIVRKRILMSENDSVDVGCEKLAELLKSDLTIDAVFCFNDEIALPAMETIESLNLRVSKDIGVIGYDDNDYPQKGSRISLTSVSYEIEEVGILAAQALKKKIEKKHNESFEYYLVMPRVVERNSCLGKVIKDVRE